jgi:hypothetical protein
MIQLEDCIFLLPSRADSFTEKRRLFGPEFAQSGESFVVLVTIVREKVELAALMSSLHWWRR